MYAHSQYITHLAKKQGGVALFLDFPQNAQKTATADNGNRIVGG